MLTIDELIAHSKTLQNSDFDYTEELFMRIRTHTSSYIRYRVLSCRNYGKNGNPNGIHAVRCLDSGIICDIFQMHDGKIHGPRVTFCPVTHKLFEIRQFVQGNIHGVVSRYDTHGHVIHEALYINGESMSEQLRQLGITKFSSMSDTQRSHIKLALGVDL